MPEATRCPEYAQSGGNAQASSSTSQLVPLTTPSASTLALLSLTQDITALISLSVEATASLLHDWLRSSLASVGLARVQAGRHVSLSRRMGKSKVWGEAGQGLAVVVVGASEPTGQSLCLHLAKSGYTVFPLLPLPSPASPPTSHALSALLLTWSTAQKRLRARYPHHPGSIVPIMTDPERSPYRGGSSARGTGSFAHAGETVRAYLRESGLRLSAVVCASRNREPSAGWNTEVEGEGSESSSEAGHGVEDGWQAESPDMQMIEDFRGTDTSDHGGTQMDGEDEDEEQTQHQQTQSTSMVHPPVQFTRRQQGHQRSLRSTSTSPEAYRNRIPRFRSTGNTGLLASDESTLLSLYRSNVLDPLLIIRELQDLLSGADPYPIGSEINAGSGGKGRVVFVNGPAVVLDRQAGASDTSSRAQGAARIINAARAEATRLLRSELCEVGVTVCEVAVGPMAPRIGSPGCHFRHRSDESAESTQGGDGDRSKLIKGVLHAQEDRLKVASPTQRDVILASRLALLQQLWAVDDALLYSSVRRAIEDRYPRATHHAGISPLVERVLGVVPGSGLMKAVGRWVLGRLLMPRNER